MRDGVAAAAYLRGGRASPQRRGRTTPMKKMGLFSIIFSVVGCGLLIGTFALVHNTRAFVAKAKTAPGIVIEMLATRDSDGGTMYKPVVEFTASDGQKRSFESSISSNPPSYDVGEAVEVLYAPEKPSDARIKGFWSIWFGPLIMGILGTVFASIGLGILYAHRRTKQKNEWLMANGTEVQADFSSVEKNTSLKVNGRSPWRITAQWHNQEAGTLHVFNSENLWFDPTQFVAAKKKLRVLIDPHNPKRYYVDVSFLPTLAEG
jgi:hypothetical protein